jgi:hypothetical protein
MAGGSELGHGFADAAGAYEPLCRAALASAPQAGVFRSGILKLVQVQVQVQVLVCLAAGYLCREHTDGTRGFYSSTRTLPLTEQ